MCFCTPRHLSLSLQLSCYCVGGAPGCAMGDRGVRMGGGRAGDCTDPEGLQPSAPIPGPPEARHDAGGGTVAGRAGMAAQEQLRPHDLLRDGRKVSQGLGPEGCTGMRAGPQGRFCGSSERMLGGGL